MLFAMHALDVVNPAVKREHVHEAHAAHLKKAKDYSVTIVLGGPLLSNDGKVAIGSLMVLEEPDSGAAEAFNRADHFYKNKI